MTARWTAGMSCGSGLGDNSYGNGYGLSNGNGFGSSGNGFGGGYGLSNGNGWGGDDDSNGFGDIFGAIAVTDSDGNGVSCRHGGGDYPERHYDSCTAIGRLRTYEATLPIVDLLTLAVTR